jgi:hypothetical protein
MGLQENTDCGHFLQEWFDGMLLSLFAIVNIGLTSKTILSIADET